MVSRQNEIGNSGTTSRLRDDIRENITKTGPTYFPNGLHAIRIVTSDGDRQGLGRQLESPDSDH